MSNSLNMRAREDMFRFVLKGRAIVQNMTKDVLKEIGMRLVMRSVVGNPNLWHPPYWPKGYHPGHFKNNWQLSADVPATNIIGGEDPTGQASLMRMQKSIPRWPAGKVYYFTNNVPYAALLETGMHSHQVAPQGIVGLTRSEFGAIARQVELTHIDKG